jgi:hypothetical protein
MVSKILKSKAEKIQQCRQDLDKIGKLLTQAGENLLSKKDIKFENPHLKILAL